MSKFPVKMFAPETEGATETTITNGTGKKGRSKGKGGKKATSKPRTTKAKAKNSGPRKVDPTKLDQFGFRKGSKKSAAAAMYASAKGATLNEVKEKLDSTQFNLLNEVQDKGYTIELETVKGSAGRSVTRYKIVTK